MRIYSQQVSALLPNSETWPIKQWQKWRDLSYLATILATKPTATSIAVTLLLHSHFKEDEHHLWLAGRFAE